MPREERMRSLSLLDKEAVNRKDGDMDGIGAELFGMNLLHTEREENVGAACQEEGALDSQTGNQPVEVAEAVTDNQEKYMPHQEMPVPEALKHVASDSGQADRSGRTGTFYGRGQEATEQAYMERAQPAEQSQAEVPPKTRPIGREEVVEQVRTPSSYSMGAAPPFYREPEVAPVSDDFLTRGGPIQPREDLNEPRAWAAGTQESEYHYRYPKLPPPEPSQKSIPRRIISVYSPKGGVGKSTISKELAMAFSMNSVHGSRLKVLIMDADWEFGDVSTLFNVTPRPNVSDWIRDMLADKRQTGHLHLYTSREIESRYIVPYSNNLHILAGPGDPAEAELITEEMVLAIMESLKRTDYDIVIIDSANSNRARTLIPLMKSDAVVLIETLDTSTVAETTAVLNTLRSKQFDFNKLYMALNQVPDNDSQIDLSVSEISRLLQLDIAAVIPRYEMIRMINNAGEAAVQKKSTPYSKAIIQLANRMVPLFEEKKQKSLFGFLGLRKRRK